MQIQKLLLLVTLTSLSFGQVTAIKQIDLQDLIKEGLSNNPFRQAYYEDIGIAESKVSQSGALPDPMLSLNLMNLPFENFGFDQEPMSGKQVAFKQGIPFPGKLGLKEQIAKVGVKISNDQYAEVSNGLVRDISKTYYDLFFVDEAIATIDKNRQLVSELLKVAEQKYAVGKGLQQDVLKAQVELSLMTERLISLNQSRDRIEANLNALLNRPIDQSFGSIQKPQIKQYSLSFAELKAIGDENRPLLKQWQNRIERSGRKIELAKKNLLPDFAISAAYTQRDILQSGMGGADFLSTGISLNLPIYAKSKQKQNINEKRIEQKSLEERREGVQQKVYRDISNGLTELIENTELLELYRTGIIPQAAQSLESTLTGYQTDKVDFLTLISSQMTLFNLELEYAKLISKHNKNIVDLEFFIGTSLPLN
ncbi:MAG: TolC family protein [Candidatus Marinimicrobia bacterium]|nr:TolC family protein [Candidatus Neomarinimicrobiota bacterium]